MFLSPPPRLACWPTSAFLEFDVSNLEHFKTLSNASLHFIIRDASEAAFSMWSIGDKSAEAKYLDQVNDACTILAQRKKEGGGWQPIEKAPKDGTLLLLGSNGPFPWVKQGFWVDEFGGGWFSGFICASEGPQMLSPTHFKPLPEPPK